jgi:hypothetical protein
MIMKMYKAILAPGGIFMKIEQCSKHYAESVDLLISSVLDFTQSQYGGELLDYDRHPARYVMGMLKEEWQEDRNETQALYNRLAQIMPSLEEEFTKNFYPWLNLQGDSSDKKEDVEDE